MAKRNTGSIGKTGQTREERLKAALKANLGRRKAQARSRAQDSQLADQHGGTSHLDAPTPEAKKQD